MNNLVLYAPKSHVNAGAKVQLVAKFLQVPLEFNRIPMSETKTPEHLKRHPLGKIPVLETPEGCIFESHAIIRYLARKAGKMYGSTPIETAQIDQWLQFSHSQVYAFARTLYVAVFGYFPSNEESYGKAKTGLLNALQAVENRVKDNEFLAGKQISVADVVVAAGLRYAFSLIFDEKSRQQIPNTIKWFTKIMDEKACQQFYGKTWLCQKQFTPDFQFTQKKKEEPKKKAQQKKQQPKKNAPKKKKEEDEQQQQDVAVVAEKKKKNPLDELPKSSFNLDDFKRDFCNAEDRPEALKRFWAAYDPEGWSLWKSDYILYEGQGKVGYLTCNLKNGFLRNLDHFRKYTFSVLGVYGDEGDLSINGAWLWRGTEIPEEWKQHNSYEYFKFERLDHNNQEHRKLIEDYWLNIEEGNVEGRPVYEAKWFK